MTVDHNTKSVITDVYLLISCIQKHKTSSFSVWVVTICGTVRNVPFNNRQVKSVENFDTVSAL